MEIPGQRQWDPNATSVLWAHEIRRENIQLVNQVDNAKADLSAVVKTINHLKQTVEQLNQSVVNQRSKDDQKLTQIGNKLDTVLGNIESLEKENQQLKARLEAMERENSIRTRELSRVTEEYMELDPRPMQNMDVQLPCSNSSSTRNRDGHGEGCTDTKRMQHEPDILVPDSAPSQRQTGAVRTLSETTWGSSVDLDACGAQTIDRQPAKSQQQSGSATDLLQSLAQDGRTLTDYLSCAQKLRPQLLPVQRDSVLVEAFVRGLHTSSWTKTIKERLDHCTDRSWDDIVTIIQGTIRQEKSSINQMQQQSATILAIEGMPLATTKHGLAKYKGPKKRRFIPIIPADEDDTRIAASMYMPMPDPDL